VYSYRDTPIFLGHQQRRVALGMLLFHSPRRRNTSWVDKSSGRLQYVWTFGVLLQCGIKGPQQLLLHSMWNCPTMHLTTTGSIIANVG
jgi:hypothetical protein